jgi:hypothetical protein
MKNKDFLVLILKHKFFKFMSALGLVISHVHTKLKCFNSKLTTVTTKLFKWMLFQQFSFEKDSFLCYFRLIKTDNKKAQRQK